ncbi:hypothetical protein [Desertibacillus haloalkaliphilus]|uniref:hypothetical protein n=1 Tax=Desertibacillus haloalkaliphilus TaxID=1328930 RepID=UPI001C25AA4F|nr:hypothetical protein [Desertibacillus haloalkaliphilus]MBU8907532.1 hypothetical protein [Desertibacillus haloalkaliphilus]
MATQGRITSEQQRILLLDLHELLRALDGECEEDETFQELVTELNMFTGDLRMLADRLHHEMREHENS